MSLTPSNMLALGTKAPTFELLDTVSGESKALDNLSSDKGTMIMFICNHCPYVIHLNEEIVKVANEYQAKGINFIAISSNDVANYPADSPDKMTQVAKDLNYPFPYLYDESQEVAKAYDAACTPDFYLFNGQQELYYRGRFDGSTPGNGVAITGEDLKGAMDNLLEGGSAGESQKPSMGCNIKWKR